MNTARLSILAHAIAASMLLAATPALAQQAISKVSDDIKVQAGQVAGQLDTVSGDIDIDGGARAGHLNTVSGDIEIDSKVVAGNANTVSGDIEGDDDVQLGNLQTVSGDIKLDQRARVGSAQTVSGDIRFGEGAQLASAETVSGDVFIANGGRVAKGVQTLSGSIGLVATQVGGDVVTYTGNVTVGIGSHVRGGLTVRKPNNSGIQILNVRVKARPPRIIIGPNARVDGPLRFEHPVKLYVHSSAKTGAITGATAVRFDTPRAPAD